MSAVLPGSTIGFFGGGQLGRMSAMAARSLGYHVQVLDPDPSCAARFVVDQCITAAFDDEVAAAYLATRCSVVTLEIEKISIASLEAAARHAPVRPAPSILYMIQDRGRQKAWLAGKGFPLGPYVYATSAEEVATAIGSLGGGCVVKSCSGGYDGRGQVRASHPGEGAPAWSALGGTPVVVERMLALEAELSVLVARRPNGETAVYPAALNHHENGILDWSAIPAPLPPAVTGEATVIARAIAEELKLEGLLTVEFFLGEGGKLLVNELAPRTHNSFHSTETACLTSQFEQGIRAVCDLPLGAVEVTRPTAIANLLGDAWLGDVPPAFDAALAMPGVRLHLYGKRQPRAGRKMGHLTAIGATPDEAAKRVVEARRVLMHAGARVG